MNSDSSYTFNEYQEQSKKTAGYPTLGYRFVYPALGLAGESGEVVEKIKKLVRDKQGILTESDRELLKKELGDVLWYLTQIATDLDITLEEVARENIIKLYSRLERGALHGDGDIR